MGNYIKVLGVDIAKEVFQLCGINQSGKIIYSKKIKRDYFLETVINLKAELIVMEACGGANHWARRMKALGVNVKLVSPQHVKPYVRTNKTDSNDAYAIAEVGSRCETRFIVEKTLEQQDTQSLLMVRQRLIRSRTALINEIRGLLLEYGITIPKSASKVYHHLPDILSKENTGLTVQMKKMINRLYCELLNIDEEIAYYERELKVIFNQSEVCQRIESIPGVGFLTALATLATVGDTKNFKAARQFSAFLGLVPKQHSSGGKEVLLGISKRGNVLLRTFLVHGARSVMRRIEGKEDKTSIWLRGLLERRGFNKACVALANKNARIIWALLKHEQVYQVHA